MIFRTYINNIKYYLILDSKTENNLPFKKIDIFQDKFYADKAGICKKTGTGSSNAYYISPILIREDLLTNEYQSYISSAFSSIKNEVDVEKGLNLLHAQQSHKLCSTFCSSEEQTSMISSKMTDTELVLKKTIYPRYTHHIFVTQFNTPDIHYQLNAITKDIAYDNFKGKNIVSYLLNVSNSFSPIASIRHQPFQIDIEKKIPVTPTGISALTSAVASAVTSGTTSSANQQTTTEVISETILVPIINDKKFVCATPTSRYGIDRYYNFYFEPASKPYVKPGTKYASVGSKTTTTTTTPTTATPTTNTTETKPEVEAENIMKLRVDDSILYKGNNNTNINTLNQLVNIFTLADITNTNNHIVKDVTCYLARLDTYVDPIVSPQNTISAGSIANVTGVIDASSDKSSPYYNMPRIYPVGIMPADYSQCITVNGQIDVSCRGSLYIDGINYSDARKIDFEVTCIELNPM